MSRPRLVCLLLALITLLVYLPVRHFEFVDFDDGSYVAQNPLVQAGLTWTGVKAAFTTWHAKLWHPVTTLSHMLDCQLFDLDAGKHHLVNVLFHAANAVLLFLLLLRLTAKFWTSALIAALFAWHPLRVESVAWVAERKDVLSAFFGLLALLAYARYARKREQALPATVDYGLALLCYALGVMAKPMLVTLPCVLLLLDYWPLQRLPDFEFRAARMWRLVAEKWPFFVLAAGSAVLTFRAQHAGGAVALLERLPLSLRLENAVVSYANYVGQTFWPVNLAALYPLPVEIPWWQTAAAGIGLAAVSWLAWRQRRQQPWLLIGWLWFLGMLVPVSGIMQVGSQACADRFTYLPGIGLLVAAILGLGDLAARWRIKPAILVALASVVLAACLFASVRQLRFWHDSEVLFTRILAVTRNNPLAEDNLGYVLYKKKRLDEAIVYFRRALSIQPVFGKAHDNLGCALLEKGQVDEAIAEHRTAIQIERAGGEIEDLATAENNLGFALLQKDRFDEAIGLFQQALEIQPALAKAHDNLGFALLQKGRVDEAIAEHRRAVEIEPGYANAHFNLGDALLQKGELAEAVGHYEQAIAIQPDFARAHNNLGVALLQMGRGEEAIPHFQRALESDPAFAEARFNLGDALLKKGRVDDAIAQYRKILETRPDFADVHNNLGGALLQKGQVDEAIAHFQKTLEARPDLAQTHNNLGEIFLRRGQVTEAIAHFQKVIDLQPANVGAQARLAWLLATLPNASFRDGARALALARTADRLAGGRNALVACALAAACAEAGNFPEAIATARRALQLAEAQRNTALVSALRTQIGAYEAGTPFRDNSLINDQPARSRP